MAITVTELPKGEGSQAFNLQIGWYRTYKRVFQCVSTSRLDRMVTMRDAVPVAVGNSYAVAGNANEVDKYSFCQSITARCVAEDGLQWEVEVEYGPYDPTTRPENPLDQPPDVDWDAVQFERIIDQEADQGDGSDRNAIVNSAGIAFDPGVTVDDSRPILRVTRNEASYNAQLADQLRDTVNASTWLEWDPRTAKIASIKAHRAFHPIPGYYWVVSYEIAFNRDGWDREILDAGMYTLQDAGKYQQVADVNGVPATAAVPLDGNGMQLKQTDPPSASQFVYLPFKVYAPSDFSLLEFDKIGPVITGGGGGGGSG